MHWRIFLFLSLIVFLAAGRAQTSQPRPTASPAPSVIPLFRASLPGGTYEVAVRRIVAVSIHEYIVDAVARVTEVNIDTDGSLLARFYFLEPNTPNAPGGIGAAALEKAQQLLTTAADKTGQDAWKKVVKNYPTTTHSRTVEYRLESRADLDRIFAAAEECFRLQQPKSVSIQ